MYEVLTDFKDLRDGGHEYKRGDLYPRAGLKVDGKRIRQLSSPTPMRDPLISSTETAARQAAQKPPAAGEEKPKKAVPKAQRKEA